MDAKNEFLSKEGLVHYDEKIKQYIKNIDELDSNTLTIGEEVAIGAFDVFTFYEGPVSDDILYQLHRRSWDFSFMSDGVLCTSFSSEDNLIWYTGISDAPVYGGPTPWAKDAYRTLICIDPMPQDLRDILVAAGTFEQPTYAVALGDMVITKDSFDDAEIKEYVKNINKLNSNALAIGEDVVVGRPDFFVFNEGFLPSETKNQLHRISWDFNFESNGVIYSSLMFDEDFLWYYASQSTLAYAYQWEKDEYRTLRCIDPMPEDLRAVLLETNAGQFYNDPILQLGKEILTDNDISLLHNGLASTTYVDNKVASKVDKVTGKGLSTNDYTTTEKNKLESIVVANIPTAEEKSAWNENLTKTDLPLAKGTGTDSLSIQDGLAKGNYSIAGGSTDNSIVKEVAGTSASANITPAEAQGTMSMAFGGNATAMSAATLAIGANVSAGCKAYYFDSIDFANKKITLSTTRRTSTLTNPSYPSTIDWKKGDRISIKNEMSYVLCSKITDVNGNVITVDKLPFDKINYESVLTVFVYSLMEDRAVINNDRPDKGAFALGAGAVAIGSGYENLNSAQGTLSYAFGYENKAAGNFGIAAGRANISGHSSVAMGHSNEAIGESSTAFGYKNKATGTRATALGTETTASGNHSISAGSGAKALGSASLALGFNSEASNTASVALGHTVFATGIGAVALGRGVGKTEVRETVGEKITDLFMTVAPNSGGMEDFQPQTVKLGEQVPCVDSTTYNSTTITFQNDNAYNIEIQYNIQVTRYEQPDVGDEIPVFIDEPYTLVVRAGKQASISVGDYYNYDNPNWHYAYGHIVVNKAIITGAGEASGEAAFHAGKSNLASGDFSVALTTATIASGKASVAAGHSSQATAQSAIALGQACTAIGLGSAAIGSNVYTTDVRGQVVVGAYNENAGNNIFVVGAGEAGSPKNAVEISASSGYFNVPVMMNSTLRVGTGSVSGTRAVSLGSDTTASGNHSLAAGSGSKASGSASFAMGTSAEATNTASIALGHTVKSNGVGSVAIGRDSQSTNEYSFGGGRYSVASGQGAFAFGYETEATGARSIAIGQACKSYSLAAVAIGSNLITSGDKNNKNDDTARGQFVCGRYNVIPDSNDIFVVGNGNGSTRSNAFKVKSDGSVVIGNVTLTTENLTKLVALLEHVVIDEFGNINLK